MRFDMNGRRGFTLVETLAAFAILAIVLSQLLSGASGAARNESRADFLFRAARQGQSQLDALGIGVPLQPGETQGRYEDGLDWIMNVEPHQIVRSATGAPLAASYAVRLVVSRPPLGTDRLILSTLKVVAAAETVR